MKYFVLFFISILTVLANVPSDINYHGRLLTNNSGEYFPVTGEYNFSVKIYDDRIAGNELYSENIGNVNLDQNGFYSFVFGGKGVSLETKTELVGFTDGSKKNFAKDFSGRDLIPGTITVSQGDYSWNDIDGNPGRTATIELDIMFGFIINATIIDGGSNYLDPSLWEQFSPPFITVESDTGSAAEFDITVEDGVITNVDIKSPGSGYSSTDQASVSAPVLDFSVDFSDGIMSVNYGNATPEAAQEILVSFTENVSSIFGATAIQNSGQERWLEISIDGEKQTPREKILTVPFAFHSKSASQASGQLLKDVNEFKSSIDSYSGINVQDFKEGDTPIEVPAGYALNILNLSTGTYSNSGYDYMTHVRYKTPRESSWMYHNWTGYAYYDNRNQTGKIYGPCTVEIYNQRYDGYMQYFIAPNDLLNVQDFKEGDTPIEVPTGYALNILNLSTGTYSNSGYDYMTHVRYKTPRESSWMYHNWTGYAYYDNRNQKGKIYGPCTVEIYNQRYNGYMQFSLEHIGTEETYIVPSD